MKLEVLIDEYNAKELFKIAGDQNITANELLSRWVNKFIAKENTDRVMEEVNLYDHSFSELFHDWEAE